MTDNTAKRIGEFELIDHGIEHSQYFHRNYSQAHKL